MTNARTEAEQRFPVDIAQHHLEVIRCDGVYRHLRFSRPGTRNMSFDIITWPGYLAYVGDMGDFVFERVEDMLNFFRGDRINPGYWAEKVQAEDKGSGVKEYSEDMAEAWIKEQTADLECSDEKREEINGIICGDGEYEVRRTLDGFMDDDGDLLFQDHYEASFQDFTYHYIWCCLALVWAVKQFDLWTDAQAAAQLGKIGLVPHG